MAKYLRTSSITSELENLIRDARKEVYIISPYLKLSDHVKELLNDKEREKVDVRIIFGKQELAPNEMSFLEDLKYVRLYFSKNLHAKCYLNESKMIIASMNLYEFSQQNNREMGILIDTSIEEDKQVYLDATKDIASIIHNSQDFSYVKAPQKKANKNIGQKVESTKLISKPKGKLLSATALGKIKDKKFAEVKKVMEDKNLICEDKITIKGEDFGMVYKENAKGDKWIVYPESLAKLL